MKKSEKMTAAKKLTILALVIFIVFVLLNIFWFLTIYFPCYSYRRDMERGPSAFGIGYQKQIDSYTYSLAVPHYMFYDPFISLEENTAPDPEDVEMIELEDGSFKRFSGNNVILFVWPKIGGTYEYGVVMEARDGTYMTYADENGNYIPNDNMSDESNERARQLNIENHEKIIETLTLAKNFWGFNGLKDTTNGMKAFAEDLSGGEIFIITVSSAAFIIVSLTFIWLFSVRLPFDPYIEELAKEKKYKKILFCEVLYKKEIKDYSYIAYQPSYLKNNGWLSVIKNAFPIRLTVYPNKKGDDRYIIKCKQGDTHQELCMDEFLKNGAISKEDKEEVMKMLKEAEEFWGFES